MQARRMLSRAKRPLPGLGTANLREGTICRIPAQTALVGRVLCAQNQASNENVASAKCIRK